jgi:Tfp pilus assembly protein PilF
MRFIVYAGVVLGMTPQLQATALDDIYAWVDQEYKDFRTYPRISKAYQKIKKGNKKEARLLLEKALEIDEKNQDALRSLITLCVNERDEVCIQKYYENITDENFGYYYTAHTQSAMKKGEYEKALEYAQKSLEYELKEEDKDFIKRMIVESQIKLKKYDEATAYISNGTTLTDRELLEWSKFSQNLKESEYAQILASKLSPTAENLKWEIDLLTERKQFKKASRRMEKLHALEQSEESKKRLLHLYALSNQDANIVQSYEAKLEEGCDAYALYYVLDYYKNIKDKQIEVLEKNHPYGCISKEKQDELTLQLVTLLEEKSPADAKNIAQYLVPGMELLYKKEHTSKNKKKLTHLYNLADKKTKLMKLYDAELTQGCNEKALFYLLDYYKDIKEEQVKILDRHYPFACVSQKKRSELLLAYIGFIEKRSPKRAKKVAKELIADMEKRPKGSRKEEDQATLMHLYTLAGEEHKIMAHYRATLKNQCDDYALSYLLDYYKDNLDEQQKLLSNNYPFSCLSSKKRAQLSFQLATYLSENNTGRAVEVLDGMAIEDPSDVSFIQQVASLYMRLKKPLRALETYEQNPESYDLQYYALNAKVAHRGANCEVASESYKKALAIESSEHLRYAQINLLNGCGEENKALALMKKFTDDYPNNLKYREELAFMYSNNKDYNHAIENFKYIAEQEPTKLKNHQRLAYLYDKVGDKASLVDAYKSAIDNVEDMDASWLENSKNVIRDESKDFSFYFSERVRLDSYDTHGGQSPINSASYDGFGDLQLSFSPNILDDDLSLFLEVSHGYNHALKETAQPSIGVRYKLLEDEHLYLSAQKMFDTAQYTRDDTLLRTSYSLFEKDKKESDFFYNLYGDAAYFTEFGSTMIYGNYEYGKIYTLNEKVDVAPYITTGGTYSNDNVQKESVTKLDIGLGVAIEIPFHETQYASNSFVNRVKLEAREKYLGNAEDEHAIHLQWEIFY